MNKTKISLETEKVCVFKTYDQSVETKFNSL